MSGVPCWMRRLRRADFPAAVDEAVSLVRFYVALSLALSSPSSSYFNDSRRAQILNRSLLASPVLAYNACKRRPRGSFRGGRADGSQIWSRFACDHRWRLSRSADSARGHGRAPRGEKRQRSSGLRSESVLPVCQLLSPNPLDVWGRQGARRSARTRTSGDRRVPLAGGRHPPPRADRTAVREALGSLQDGVWCRARLSWALFGRRRTSPACGPQGGGLQQSARRRATGTSGEPLG